jgi:hypothetical protein
MHNNMSLTVNPRPLSSSSSGKAILSRAPSTTSNEYPSADPGLEMRDLQPRRRPTISQAERTEAAASAALGGQGLYLAEDEKDAESELFNPDGSATIKQKRNAFKALMGAGVITLITIWAASTWLFGSLYNAEARVHNLKVSCGILVVILGKKSIPFFCRLVFRFW